MRKLGLTLLGAVAALLLVALGPSLVGGTGPSGAGLDFAGAMGKSTLLAAGVVFVGGILTSLSPCVYPLIPITVAIFGARDTKSRLQGAVLSTVYVLGMAVMYTALGIGAALTGKAFGNVMSNPWVIGFVALVFITFAVSLLGAFELNLPPSLQTKLAQVGGQGFGGAFAMGLVSGIVAAPCTGPVLGGVLTYVATSQDVVLGGGLLFVFAIGMGLLFWVLGTFAVSLPKSGPWMDTVKYVLAVVMLVAALYFLKDVIPGLKEILVAAPWVPWVTGALTALGVLLVGSSGLPALGTVGARAAKGVGLVLVVGALFYRTGSLAVVPETHKQAVSWYHDERSGLVAAGVLPGADGTTAAHRPVMIDFTAEWCAACKELEKFTYPDPQVSSELQRFVSVRIDVSDDESPEYARLQKKYGFPGLPYVVFIGSDGARRPDLTVTGFLEPDAFLEKLQQVE